MLLNVSDIRIAGPPQGHIQSLPLSSIRPKAAATLWRAASRFSLEVNPEGKAGDVPHRGSSL